jgi:NADP-dependent 3-hydroxy acid dehydrogenase YdfG
MVLTRRVLVGRCAGERNLDGMALTILVTRATAGFGAAMARRFVRDGHRVIAAARRTDRLLAMRTEIMATCQAPGPLAIKRF